MRMNVPTAIGALWFIALAFLVLFGWYIQRLYGGVGIGIDLPDGKVPRVLFSVLFSVLVVTFVLGWIPVLAVGIYRMVRKH